MIDTDVQKAVEAWLADDAIADEDRQEIRVLVRDHAEKELTDRFYRELEFGTGGLRGVIGAGLNRMNLYTVGAAAQGLANQVNKQGEAAKRAGVAIAFDCRRKSDEFALRVACVMAGNGIKAFLFEALRPTPELSFAVRHLGCVAGIVVTASHNPPEYNGFKAYWKDGGQVVPPQDGEIINEVRAVGAFSNIKSMGEDTARAQGLIQTIGRDIDDAFLDEVQSTCLSPEVCREQGRELKVVFTALHGTGGVLIPEALRRRGFERVIEVREQAAPDGEFPTVESPNPEEAAALELGIQSAQREGADLVIATDPDADRMGIAVRRSDGEFELLSGNRIGALLCYYICEELTRLERFPDNAVVLSTVVSSDQMKAIARSYGAEVTETLTGFKWIAQKLNHYDLAGSPESPSKAFVFGAEESYGYLPAGFTRDKDAVTSAAFTAEMAAWAAAEGKSLCDVLDELFKRYGYYQEGAKNLVMKGKEGATRIAAIMDTLRKSPPREIGGIQVVAFADFATGANKDANSGEILGRFDLPPANVLQFKLSDETKVIARPSGTEPKIKFYILTQEDGDDLRQARIKATEKIDAIAQDLLKMAGI